MPNTLNVIPVRAPVQETPFPLIETIAQALADVGQALQDGDVLAISSKYVAISENRIITLADIVPGERALQLAERYNMDAHMAQLVVDEADHIFGGIPMGYLLTWRSGIIAPNAGIDRSNIPNGLAVLLPEHPYDSAHALRDALNQRFGVRIGIILTDSWLVPGRWGTTGVALASAGFSPTQDERGKEDLFGNPMSVTVRGIADSLSICAQTVMGERDEATPLAIIRGADIQMTDARITQDDVAIPWEMCIYVESLTLGLQPDGAPRESMNAKLGKRDKTV
ncbi:MAG: coenzyme F420-0:L-glutamate ligase [Anaerolineae bacterium]|nr:coenzyme F420-0:L-glutamate ligase [Anaerolineae bacterium]